MTDQIGVQAPIPLLNEPAPTFRARTTQGERSLESYRGRWLLLFSHPADFTPVCASEFVAFTRAWPDFQACGCDLIALSVDSLFSHLAWVRSLRDHFGIEVPFPVIEDVSMTIARAYGMIHPQAASTATVRACHVIDPEGLLRASTHYPVNVGRNVPELLRLVQAIQFAEAERVSTPAGWVPGDDVLLPTPLTLDEADARAKLADARDWYFLTGPVEARHD